MYSYFDDFFIYLKIEKNSSQKTIDGYQGDLWQFLDFISKELGIKGEEISPQNINHLHIRKYLSHLQDMGLTRTTIARKLAALRSFFKFLCREELIAGNPILKISTPKLEKRLPGFLYQDEIKMVLEAPDISKPQGQRDKAILETLYASGIRVSELVGINLGDIDFDIGYVRVMGKGSKERTVPLGSYALEAIELYIKNGRKFYSPGNDRENALFLNKYGKRLTVRSIRNILNKYVKKVSLKKKVSPHTVRHSFATHLLDNGADLRSVQEFLGHIRMSTTQIYLDVTKEKIKSVYNKAHPRA